MKFSMKVALGLFAIAGLAGIYYGDNYFSQKKEESAKEANHAIYFETKDILTFKIKNKNGLFVFNRKTNETPWMLLSPKELSADQDAANNILTAIQQLKIQQEIKNTETLVNAKDKKVLAPYGLENPNAFISIEKKSHKESILYLGNALDLGNKISGQIAPISIYAQNPSKNNLLVVDTTLAELISNKNLADFRTKRVSDFKRENVNKILINYNNENITVIKENKVWKVLKPNIWAGDENFISDFLSRYQGLLAQKIYELDEINDNLIEKLNLKNPIASVTFAENDVNIIQTFKLGITKDGIYTFMKDGAIAKINLELWPELVPKEKLFKNRSVMLNVSLDNISKISLSNSLSFIKKDNNWYKVSSSTQQPSVSEAPNQDAFSFFSNWEYMTADDMILNPTNDQLNQFGILKPLKTFSFEFIESSNLKPIKIIIGNRVPKNEKNVYLKRSDSPTIYIVEAGWLTLLAQLYSVGDSSNTSVKKQME